MKQRGTPTGKEVLLLFRAKQEVLLCHINILQSLAGFQGSAAHLPMLRSSIINNSKPSQLPLQMHFETGIDPQKQHLYMDTQVSDQQAVTDTV